MLVNRKKVQLWAQDFYHSLLDEGQDCPTFLSPVGVLYFVSQFSLSSTLRIHWVCFCDIEIQLTALQYDQYDKASSMYNISYRKKWPKHGTWWKEQFLATLRKLWRQITPWTIREVRIFCVLVKTRTNGLSR